MAKDEIISGLQNAVARGQTLDQAAQSFKNAGYNPREVDEAKNSLSGGGMGQVAPQAPSRPGESQGGTGQVPSKGNNQNQQQIQSKMPVRQNNNMQSQQMQAQNNQGGIMSGQRPMGNQVQMMQQQKIPGNQAPAAPPGNLQVNNKLPNSKSEKSNDGGGGKTALIIIVILLLLIFIGALGYLVYYLAT
jgi:hypothetical protein